MPDRSSGEESAGASPDGVSCSDSSATESVVFCFASFTLFFFFFFSPRCELELLSLRWLESPLSLLLFDVRTDVPSSEPNLIEFA